MSGTAPVRIRQVDSEGVAEVCELFAGYLEFYEIEAERERIRDFLVARAMRRESIIFLAETGGRAVGFLQVYPTFSSLALAPVWILNDLFVLPQARRAGVGRALVRSCLREARSAGVASVELQTARTNESAQSLYRAEGFEPDETFVCFGLHL
jgi:ribosomal protein S18 acetylase RimI-like enzyme